MTYRVRKGINFKKAAPYARLAPSPEQYFLPPLYDGMDHSRLLLLPTMSSKYKNLWIMFQTENQLKLLSKITFI